MGTLGITTQHSGHGGSTGKPAALALLRRLERCNAVPEEDRALIRADVADVRPLAPHQPCIRQGQTPSHVFLVLQGWMIRWQILPDGSRQLTGFLLPGDFCNDPATVAHGFDAGVSALGAAR